MKHKYKKQNDATDEDNDGDDDHNDDTKWLFVRFVYLLRQSSNRTNVAKSRNIYPKEKGTGEYDKRKKNTIEK